MRRVLSRAFAQLPAPVRRRVRRSLGERMRPAGGRARVAPPQRLVLPDLLAPRATMHEPAPSVAGAAVRLGLVGDPPGWFTGWARTAEVSPEWAGGFVERLGSQVDALLLDGRLVADLPDKLGRLAVEAREHDARVITFAADVRHLRGFADLEVWTGDPGHLPAGRGRIALPAPVDPRMVNPVGYRPRTEAPLALVLDAGAGSPAWSAARRRAVDLRAGSDRSVEVFATAAAAHGAVPGVAFHTLPPAAGERVAALRGVVGVLDDPAFHDSAADHAARLVFLAAAGLPVWTGQLPPGVRALLGPTLAGLLEGVGAGTFSDGYRLERTSVALRRAVLAEHDVAGRWRQMARLVGLPEPPRPAVSAVMATNRPEHLARAAAQMSAQHYGPLEMVAVLHGVGVDAATEQRIRRSARIPIEILRVDGSATLGDALNAGVRASGGTVVTKVDDDDWYGASHVDDLVTALDYSGATLVGKAAEFIYLGALDVTIRRFAGKAERIDRNLAGGTLTLRRHDLDALGGWRRVRRAVDQRLLDDVIGGGGATYRTHGFGFMLNRHDEGHTWDLGVDYFLRQASAQQRGVGLGLAWIDGAAGDPVREAVVA